MKRVSVTGVTARTARICRFIVQSKDYGSTALRSLEDAEPPIWRRLEVPAEITLKDLHSVIQTAMGWENAHLFQFHVGREQLGDLSLRGIKRFTYVYDMGDNWASRRLL
jgi:pRiA4b ORF-3-like protein